jgi:hypothetical protein
MNYPHKALALLNRAKAKGLATTVIINRPGSGGTYDPVTGETTGGTPDQTFTGLGMVAGYQAEDIDGTRVIQGDQIVYAEAVNLVRTEPGEPIIVDGRNCTAISLEVVAPGGEDILYIIQVRGL